MLDTVYWKESFELILDWYYQAIQPESSQLIRKSWPIIANAVGAAALEENFSSYF